MSYPLNIPCISAKQLNDFCLAVMRTEVNSCTPSEQLHCHDFISIIYIEKAHVSMRLSNDQIVTPSVGDFLFLLPGTAHSLIGNNPSGYHTDIYIHENYFYQNIFPLLHNNPIFMNFFFTHMMPDREQPHKLISTAGNRFIEEKMAAIHEEYRQNDHLSLSIISSELVILLAHLARMFHEESTRTRYKHAKAEEIVSYISNNFLTANLNDVAWHFHYTTNYVCEMLREETGKRFTEWLHYFRINHSKTLLGNTQLPISTIATACGFETPKYFYRVFKKQTGMTPTEYREQHLSQTTGTSSPSVIQ